MDRPVRRFLSLSQWQKPTESFCFYYRFLQIVSLEYFFPPYILFLFFQMHYYDLGWVRFIKTYSKYLIPFLKDKKKE